MRVQIYQLNMLCFAIIVSTWSLFPSKVYGQETADHKEIRELLDRDQEAWLNGDVKTVLKNRTRDYMVAGVPSSNGVPDMLGVNFGRNYDQMKQQLTDPEWVGPSMDSRFDPKLQYEMSRIDVKGDNAVAVSRIEWSMIDSTTSKRNHVGWNSFWFLLKTNEGWKFKSAIGGIKSWERETDQ